MIKSKIVEVFDGTKANRSDCRYISGQYYIINKQCFKMPDGKWHRINNGLIAFDHYAKEWVFKSSETLSEGVVGTNDYSGNNIIGFFTKNDIENVTIIDKDGTSYNCLSESVLNMNNFVEHIHSGVFYHKKGIGKYVSANDLKRKGCSRYKGFRLQYAFEYQYPVFKESYDKYFSKPISLNINHSNQLKDTTFGIEYETSNGKIPMRHCLKNGLIPLRDGSLRHDGIEPYEYTTIPMTGEGGLASIKAQCDDLNKYCVKDSNGSTHIHIGSIDNDAKYAVSMYRTILAIQTEVYSMFPKWYPKTSIFKSSGKNYCNPIPTLNFNKDFKLNLDKIFYYFITGDNGGTDFNINIPGLNTVTNDQPRDRNVMTADELFEVFGMNATPTTANVDEPIQVPATPTRNRQENVGITHKMINNLKEEFDLDEFELGMEHPHGNRDSKWRISQRYSGINLISLMFSTRSTVEFRIHTSSFNHDKITNWLFIANAICRYASKHKDMISSLGTSIDLAGIMKNIYTKDLADYLISYIEYRKSYMNKIWDEDRDGSGIRDVKEDDLRDWNYNVKSLFSNVEL